MLNEYSSMVSVAAFDMFYIYGKKMEFKKDPLYY